MVEAVGEQDRKDEPRVDAVTTLGRLPGMGRTESVVRTDAELIREAQANDHSAFETLVRRPAERAFRAAYRVVRDQQAAEEVLQEALIKAYRALPRFEARSSFYTWLYRITVNLALDRRRRGKREPTLEWDDAIAHQVDPRAQVSVAHDPEIDLRRQEVRALVAEGIQTLPDAQREVLLLREVDGLSYEEIAESMRISKGTVMSRLHYARKKMIVFLAQRGVDPEDVI
ncbi:MAG: sigma-70 family RNA polymerase sigma factor [Deltaproteobacteria bacterium]|nr:sigma-70 family RNA polymerase sigma factor [Deltaproteobacteria bacterium]